MSGISSIGITGLRAAEAALRTVSHNISNAATPGYSRQITQQTTATYVDAGGGYIGQGVAVQGVKRQYNEFLDSQIMSIDARRAQFSAYSTKLGQISNMLSDPQAGLSVAIEAFFEGVNDIAANPSAIPSRQSMIASAQTMVSRFATIDARLDEIRGSVESEIKDSVLKVNDLAKHVGALNDAILANKAANASVGTADLLDQRNMAIEELNRIVNITTTTDQNGSVNVYIGGSHALVNGKTIIPVKTVKNPDNPAELSLAVAMGSTDFVIPQSRITGGELAGLMEFRNGELNNIQGQVGLIARAMMESFNAQQRLGVDLNGNIGKDLFVADIAATPATLTSPSMFAPDVTVSNIATLEQGGYRITYDSTATGGFVMTRHSDSSAVDPATVGLVVTLTGGADGDAYDINPVMGAVKGMALAFTDPRMVAAANPVAVERTLTNAGNAGVDRIDMQSIDAMNSSSGALPLFNDMVLTYNAGGVSIAGSGALTISPAAFDPATESAGKVFTVTSNDPPDGIFSFTFRLNGVPADGDSFTFKSNENGAADNRNAVKLGELQTTKTMLSGASGEGTATFQSAYSQIVVDTANQSRAAKAGESANEALLEQTLSSRESISGVNLDEEASNLMLYQQTYQASAQVIAIAQKLFEEIIGIAR